MKTRVQLNFRVSPGIASKVRADARRNNKTLDAVGETILSDFFKAWTAEERAKFYDHAGNKLTGRKVSA